MKNQLLFATLAIGFIAGLGISAVRGGLSRLPAAPVQAPPEPPATDAALPIQSAAPEPAASEPQPDRHESADSLPAPSYDQETAAHDRAAAHSARSR